MDLPLLKVISLNFHKGMDQAKKKSTLADDLTLINTEQPDLVALQEVETWHLKPFISAGYHVIFGANLNCFPFHFGNVILTRHPVLYHRHHYLPGQLEPRGLDEAALDIGGQMVTVLNTHLGLQMHERTTQFTAIQGMIRCLSGPIILLGDFNTEPSDDLFTELRGQFGEIGPPGAKTCPVSPQPRQRLDQMWYNNYLQLIRGSVLTSWLVSDHFPIMAELKLVKANPVPGEPVIPVLPQDSTTLLVTHSELDSPEIQFGAEAEAGATFNRDFAEVSFPLNQHWLISAQYQMGGAQNQGSGITTFRVGYTPGAFDLRDYLSLMRIKGSGRWLFYACTSAGESGWMEWEQAYRWSRNWGTELTLDLKNRETIWRLEQSLYLSEYLNYSLGIDTQNKISTHITISLP